MDSINLLLLPEILSKVLQYVDLKTLKNCRLVSSFWNVEAGRIMSSSYWVQVISSDMDEENDSNRKLAYLEQTLTTSQDPGKFFRKLFLIDNWLPGKKLHELLENYGKYLTALHYEYSNIESTEDGASYCQLLIYQVITNWCPNLEELSLAFSSKGVTKLSFPIPTLDFNGPNNLKIISVCIVTEIQNNFQDFLVRIVEGGVKLKVLKIYREDKNDRMYEKLAGLYHIIKNLNEFSLHGPKDADLDVLDWTNLISSLQFSEKLNSLRIYNLNLNLMSFSVLAVMLNSIGPSLKQLRLWDCKLSFDSSKEHQSDLFKIVSKSLVNLEILELSRSNENGYDYFFSNADSLDALPHQNLRQLILQSCSKIDTLQFKTVSASIVKWFPNLTRLIYSIGNENDLYTMGMGIELAEALGSLASLKRLEDVSLKIFTILAPRELQNILMILKQFPKLLFFTLEELGKGNKGKRKGSKITHNLESLEHGLKEVEHLNLIQLVDFAFTDEKSIMDFAMKNGISLKLHSHKI